MYFSYANQHSRAHTPKHLPMGLSQSELRFLCPNLRPDIRQLRMAPVPQNSLKLFKLANLKSTYPFWPILSQRNHSKIFSPHFPISSASWLNLVLRHMALCDEACLLFLGMCSFVFQILELLGSGHFIWYTCSYSCLYRRQDRKLKRRMTPSTFVNFEMQKQWAFLGWLPALPQVFGSIIKYWWGPCPGPCLSKSTHGVSLSVSGQEGGDSGCSQV